MVSQYGISQLYPSSSNESVEPNIQDNEQMLVDSLEKKFKEFEEHVEGIEISLKDATSKYPNSNLMEAMKKQWNDLLKKYTFDEETQVDEAMNNTRVPVEDTEDASLFDSTPYRITPSMMAEIEETIEREEYNRSTLKKRNLSDVPSFDLGISQPTTLSSVTPEQQTICEKTPKLKRSKGLSDVLRSPYVQRIVLLGKKREKSEETISHYIFSAQGDLWEIVFSGDECGAVMRVMMETMRPGVCIHLNVISSWASVLNYEERFRRKDSVARLFCSAVMLFNDDYTKSEVTRIDRFSSNMKSILAASKLSSIRGIDLVFIPMINYEHYYLMCFNLNNCQIDVIDNSGAEVPFKEKYNGWPEMMRNAFSGYLTLVSHPKATQLRCTTPIRMEMPWRTLNNITDCGVFLMRHMETFKGTTVKDWKCGLSSETLYGPSKQQQELDELRHKYVAKIILSSINRSKTHVVEEAKKFTLLSLAERKRLDETAMERIGHRLKEID